MTRLGELIKSKRESSGLSLRDFSERCTLSHSYIKNLEDGDPRTGKNIIPTIDSLEKIAPALEMSLEELLKRIGYISDSPGKFERSNLKLIRGSKSFEEICKEIASKTGSKINSSIYEAIEGGKDKNPSLLFIDTLAKYAGVDRSFFYRENTEKAYEEAKERSPYYSQNEKSSLSHIKDKDLLNFINSPESAEYLQLAKDLYERKIKVKFIRSTFFQE
ncbi:MAG: helix-turn-helix domain-containing protein [Clostridia bacterium]|nr:helix-turn-helix domain-containing protein [Clostridia bacterium]